MQTNATSAQILVAPNNCKLEFNIDLKTHELESEN